MPTANTENGPEGFFGEHEAERYDQSTGEEFAADVIAATVDFLADLAG